MSRFYLAFAVLALLCATAQAQETRGNIQGRITDSTGAVVPAAMVKAVNVATNVAVTTKSNAEGAYSLMFLVPGVYNINVSVTGFKTELRSNVVLQIHERIQIDFSLEVGQITESVLVTGAPELLQAATSNLGLVVDSRRMEELPITHGSPYSLMSLSPGLVFTASDANTQQMPHIMVNESSSLAVNGTPAGSTDFTIDGIPNTSSSNVNSGVGLAVSPPGDIVQEFKMETPFDATVGRTSGTVVNVSLKTGTNQPHGSAYLFLREPSWYANSFFANKTGTPRPDFKYQRWGSTLTGPVYLPKVYSGKDRTFFTFGYEGLKYKSMASTFTGSVPDPRNLSGNFSNLLALGSQYQIYDPATIQAAANGRFSIQPFAGNVIPASRIDPIAQKILSYYPAPNTTGLPDGTNNYVDNGRPEPEEYYQFIARVDHNLSERDRVYIRAGYMERVTGPYRNYWDGPTKGETYYGHIPQAAIDNVYTLSPSLVLNVRYGFSRYGGGHQPRSLGFDPAALGFQSGVVSQLTSAVKIFPSVAISGLSPMGNESADYGNTNTHSFFASLTKQKGGHNLKFGADLRAYRYNSFSYGSAGGYFNFGTTYTQGPLDNSASSPSGMGQGLAAMLLGLPSSGYGDLNASQAAQSTYWAFYFHDNWRASRKLTLDLGLRWEYEGPLTERFNRSVRGFDPTAPQGIAAQALAAYAAQPDPALPVGRFQVRGGLLFAGVNGVPRTLWDKQFDNFANFAPRVGFAYQAFQKVVVRGGFGVFPIQMGIPSPGMNKSIQSGFSQRTNLIPTLNNGQTFIANLDQPFPGGLVNPTGASLGPATFLGQSISFYNTTGKTPYDMQWDLNVQTMLPGQILLQTGYHGTKGIRLQASRQLDGLPDSFLSTSPVRDQQTINYLTQNVTNPFQGLLPGTTLNGTTIPRSQLLLPFPQFSGISMPDSQGHTWYHALQVRFERRFGRGFTVQGSYCFSKLMEATSYLNPMDPLPYPNISQYDYPHMFSFSGMWELPIGRGKSLLAGASRGANYLLGGWAVGSVWTFHSGAPIAFGNVLFVGDIKNIPLPSDQRSVAQWFNTNAGFVKASSQQLSNNLRTFPLRFGSIRAGSFNDWDLSILKNMKVYERYEFQFRAEAFNAFNHTTGFLPPTADPTSSAFGVVTGINSTPRNIQLGLKFVF
jgi:hypothetical protein